MQQVLIVFDLVEAEMTQIHGSDNDITIYDLLMSQYICLKVHDSRFMWPFEEYLNHVC